MLAGLAARDQRGLPITEVFNTGKLYWRLQLSA
jgi:hypothetical protein